jgi:transcriptional regulator with XRE-family HTH domain
MTQAELAGKLGIKQNMISDYERGKRRISQSMSKRLAKSLGIKVEPLS